MMAAARADPQPDLRVPVGQWNEQMDSAVTKHSQETADGPCRGTGAGGGAARTS